MSKNIKIISLFVCLMVFLVGCNSYKYNYKGENFQLQYDESLLMVSPAENQVYNDVFVHTNDGYYAAYVDVALVDKSVGEPKTILDNMKTYYLTLSSDGVITNEEEKSSTGRYHKSTTNIVEYNYNIEESNGIVEVIRSRVETIGMNNLVVIERYYKGVYDQKTINALDVSYESAKLALD